MLAWHFYFYDFYLDFLYTYFDIYARILEQRNFVFMRINIQNEFLENGQRKYMGKHKGLRPLMIQNEHTLSLCIYTYNIKYA